MTADHHGTPCWYELSTTDIDAARRFYGHVIGWTWAAANMEGFDYHIARSGDDIVAGAMALPPEAPGPMWTLYFAVTSADDSARDITARGGRIVVPPTDIPGTGRFALACDPQGAPFGILEPADPQGLTAFSHDRSGHGMWHELMTTGVKAAQSFYFGQFGWKAGTRIDIGPGGKYHLFRCKGADIGGMMKKTRAMPGPDGAFWLPYFSVDSVDATLARIAAAGGLCLHGPMPVPGEAFVAVARDPQGAMFAVVGGR